MDKKESAAARAVARTTAFGVTVDITPDHPVPLSGYLQRVGAYRSIRRRLEANVLGIRTAGGRPLYLVAVDALYGGAISRGLLARLNLMPVELVVFGSHTHFAPGVDPGIPRLGETGMGYVDLVVERIAAAIEGALGESDPSVGFACADTPGLFVNRRRPTLGVGIPIPQIGRIVTAPHTKGGVDATIRVATVEAGGRVIALIWGASCHPVCSPDPWALSPCFPGEVRALLREQVDADIPVLFLQGFSADVRPASQTRLPPRGFRPFANYLVAGGKRFARQSESAFVAWCDELSAVVLRAARDLDSATREPLLGTIQKAEPGAPEGWQRAPCMSRIRLTSGLSIVSVNAEITHDRVAALGEACQEATIPAGCCDEVIGYWPTDAMLREGGYEGGGSACFFPPLDWDSVGGPDALWNRMLQEAVGAPKTERLV